VGASNWAVCPRCLARAKAAEARKLAEVMASYGKIPVAEFDAARAAIEPVHPRDVATFREDYEITGAQDGAVVVSYAGGCETCGLSLSFGETRPIPGVDEAEADHA
jgi:hypothetical protein